MVSLQVDLLSLNISLGFSLKCIANRLKSIRDLSYVCCERDLIKCWKKLNFLGAWVRILHAKFSEYVGRVGWFTLFFYFLAKFMLKIIARNITDPANITWFLGIIFTVLWFEKHEKVQNSKIDPSHEKFPAKNQIKIPEIPHFKKTQKTLMNYFEKWIVI